MAVVGVVAGMVVAGMVALPSTATATPTHACIATIGLTGITGIGVTTKQWRSTNPLIGEKSVRRARPPALLSAITTGRRCLVYFEEEPGRRSAKLLSEDEAR